MPLLVALRERHGKGVLPSHALRAYREVSKLLLNENLRAHLYARPLDLVSTSTSSLYSLVLVLVALWLS